MVGQGEVTSMGPGLASCIDVGGSMSAGGLGIVPWGLPSIYLSFYSRVLHLILAPLFGAFVPSSFSLIGLCLSLSLSKHQGPNLGSNLGVSCQYQMSRVWGDLLVFLCHLAREDMRTPLNVLK